MFPFQALATWSVIAVDRATHRIVMSTATCVPQSIFAGTRFKTLADIQAVVAPGAGAAAAQALADPTGTDQALIRRELARGIRPAVILQNLKVIDKDIQARQFGILDVHGNAVGFSGSDVSRVALHVQGHLRRSPIAYSIQGNTLRSSAVILNAERAFQRTRGTLPDRTLAAMVAGDAAGGDRRCSCSSQPLPKGPCTTRNALIAYLLVADPRKEIGTGNGRGASAAGHRTTPFFYVTDENLRPGESVDPVITLRARYEAWLRASHR
ncbi:MAG: DUF1028 domain-containing protein [Steroidobacteraceae bacterium]